MAKSSLASLCLFSIPFSAMLDIQARWTDDPIILPRVGISAQNREAAINLLEQKSARPIARQRHARKRQQDVSLFPKRRGKTIRPTDQEGQLPRAPQSFLAQPLGELLRGPLAPTLVQQDFRCAPQFFQQRALRRRSILPCGHGSLPAAAGSSSRLKGIKCSIRPAKSS